LFDPQGAHEDKPDPEIAVCNIAPVLLAVFFPQ